MTLTIDKDVVGARRARILEVEQQLVALAGELFAAECRFLELIAEFDELEGWADGVTRNCAHWLNYRLGIDMGAARERVRVARCLADLPLIRAAFAQGQVSYSKVRAMTRVATEANEEFLLTIARHGTAAQLELLCRTWRRVKQADDPEREQRVREERELSWHHDDDGALVIKVRLPADDGAIVLQGLARAMDDAFHTRDRDDTESRSDEASHPKDADKDVSAETSRSADAAGRRPRERLAVRQADALVALADAYLDRGPGNRSGGDRWQLVVHTDHAALGQPDTAEELPEVPAHLAEGPPLASSVLRAIACDTSTIEVTHDTEGRIIGIGRKDRTIPWWLRRRLVARDLGCQFPGCTNSRWVDGHHIWHWADGGPTDLWNLILLCRSCHRRVHAEGIQIAVGLDRRWAFHRADGTPIPRRFDDPARDVEDLVAANRSAGITVADDAAGSLWDGSPLHLDLAVEALHWYDQRAPDVSAETPQDPDDGTLLSA